MTGQNPGGSTVSGGRGGGGTAVGITPDAVRSLATSMGNAASTAAALSQKISGITDAVDAAVAKGSRAGPGATVVRPVCYTAGPDGGALSALIRQAPLAAQEIAHRLSRFLACEAAHLPLNPALYFTDEPLPDPQKVTQAITFFSDHIGDSGGFLWSDSAQGAQEVLGNWKQLTTPELTMVLNTLTPAQLKELNGKLGEGSSWWGHGGPWWGHGGPDKNLQAEFSTLILTKAGLDAIARARPLFTHLHLDQDSVFKDDFINKSENWRPGNPFWRRVNEPLFGPGGPDPDTDIDQGWAGDCYFLAALAAVAHRDPAFIERHIWQDPNGCYTCRLYQNGKPVDVTVTPYLPGGGKDLAHTDHGNIWAAIYEKAYAQLNGGYAAIGGTGLFAGGSGADALTAITGRKAAQDSWFYQGAPASLSDIKSRLSQGHIVLAEDPVDDSESTGPGILTSKNRETPASDTNPETPSDALVLSHVYSVRRVYTDPRTRQLMIELVNPWGPDKNAPPQHARLSQQDLHDGTARAPQYVYLNQEDFQMNFAAIDDLPPGGW